MFWDWRIAAKLEHLWIEVCQVLLAYVVYLAYLAYLVYLVTFA